MSMEGWGSVSVCEGKEQVSEVRRARGRPKTAEEEKAIAEWGPDVPYPGAVRTKVEMVGHQCFFLEPCLKTRRAIS